MNDNFTDVEAQISGNAAAIQTNSDNIGVNTTNINLNAAAVAGIFTAQVYDYRNFSPTSDIVSKTFITTGSCGGTEVRTRTLTANGVNTNVLVTRRRLSGTTTCQFRDFSFINTPSERQWVQRRNYQSADSTLVSTRTPLEPIIVATSTMREGGVCANGTTLTSTPAGAPRYFWVSL